MYQNKLLPFFLLLFICSSCEHEPKAPTYEKQHLIGRWELTGAWRSNRKTETLTGIYYEFDEKGKMRTNFTLDMNEGEFDYEFDGREINQKGKMESIYAIDSLTNTTLIFSTTFNERPFKLALAKHEVTESDGDSEM